MSAKLKAMLNRVRRDNSPKGGGWAVIYTGFILIMLCFFIMLCSFSTIEQAKVTQFVKSFSTAVSILSGGLKFSRGSEVLNPSPDIVKKDDPLAGLLGELRELTGGLGAHDVSFAVTPGGLAMRLSDRILFEEGSARLSQEAKELLAKVGGLIKGTDFPIRIEGHTDNVPIKTSQFPSNWELSTARAVNVLRYFTEELGIPPSRLSAAGYGEYRPLAPNDTPENRGRNRRVEIVFLPGNPARPAKQ